MTGNEIATPPAKCGGLAMTECFARVWFHTLKITISVFWVWEDEGLLPF